MCGTAIKSDYCGITGTNCVRYVCICSTNNVRVWCVGLFTFVHTHTRRMCFCMDFGERATQRSALVNTDCLQCYSTTKTVLGSCWRNFVWFFECKLVRTCMILMHPSRTNANWVFWCRIQCKYIGRKMYEGKKRGEIKKIIFLMQKKLKLN